MIMTLFWTAVALWVSSLVYACLTAGVAAIIFFCDFLSGFTVVVGVFTGAFFCLLSTVCTIFACFFTLAFVVEWAKWLVA